MPFERDLRASDADREAAVERLRTAALEGRLEADELEDRVGDVYGARWTSELAGLTRDVTPPVQFFRPARRLNGLAVASLLAGLLWMGWFGSLAAVVMGHTALHDISRSGGTQVGRTAAIIGVAFGYFGLTVLLAMLLWIFAIP